MVEATLKAFGRIDILNNICPAPAPRMDFLEMPEEIYDFMMDVNRQGHLPGGPGRAAGDDPQQVRQDSSTCPPCPARRGYPTNIAYTASKFAVTGMTQAIAKYAAPYNINVNCVCPGIVHTRIWDKLLDDVKQAGGDPDAYWAERISGIPLKRPQTGRGYRPDVPLSLLFLRRQHDRPGHQCHRRSHPALRHRFPAPLCRAWEYVLPGASFLCGPAPASSGI